MLTFTWQDHGDDNGNWIAFDKQKHMFSPLYSYYCGRYYFHRNDAALKIGICFLFWVTFYLIMKIN